MATIVEQLRGLNLSADELKRSGVFSDDFINEFILLLSNVLLVAQAGDTSNAQVDQNTQAIASNLSAIQQNASDINDLEGDVSTNTSNIATNTTNLSNHISSNSEHGVTGDNVGTEDYAQTLVGGVVLLAALVNDATQSTVSVASPDAPVASATYSQTDTQTTVDLVNEMKGDINQLVTDVNAAIDQLNDFIDKAKTARQMSAS